MKKFLQKQWPIVFAFCLPVIFTIGITLSVYLPSRFIHTDYSFIYSVCTNANNNYDCTRLAPKYISVVNGTLTITPQPVPSNNTYEAEIIASLNTKLDVEFYSFNPTTKEHKQLTLDQAQALNINSSRISPDGVHIECGYNYSRSEVLFIFNSGRSDYNCVMVHGSRRKVLPVPLTSANYYNNDFNFIGWL
jgi:hypothetical protein